MLSLVLLVLSQASLSVNAIDVLGGMLEALQRQFPAESAKKLNVAMHESLERVAGKGEEGFSVDSFDFDFSAQCPLQWAPSSDGVFCLVSACLAMRSQTVVFLQLTRQAPKVYAGPCDEKVAFGPMTPSQKTAMAVRCGVQFKRLGETGVEDFSKAHSCKASTDFLA
eukprot:6490988-Amphidinium_carterae.4